MEAKLVKADPKHQPWEKPSIATEKEERGCFLVSVPSCTLIRLLVRLKKDHSPQALA